MQRARPSPQTLLVGVFVVIGTLWGAWLGSRHLAGLGSPLDRLENLTADLRFALAGARPAPRGVVIAAIDDEVFRAAGSYPLPRPFVTKYVL